ncbi:mitochondrial 37S ribosomal protein bS1m ASCRUDRAFT_73524 [Ascoidea rubescens DSM 1968]|uniref:Mitochondrial ribosomal protein MRP51 n=1 Tax=Ascoidea rubescens DSM 1968 TaxID=1344418 RepID=A0A1D2VQ51_9ASCO|nr:hypothetical protein ASCRUDRAFT_73524 [Ascoidea rubescens DSM 1968]ODV63726.1 hypothetical protein ASCRUDRAFT_73524 [Ascoidea rubescens DSM 1968]
MSFKSFEALLGNSRIAQLPKVESFFNIVKTKSVPTHQIIQTTSANLYRREWGLKSALPSKIKSKYIIVDQFDTIEHMTNFEKNGSFHWIKKRFQELQIPLIRENETNSLNPLFMNPENLSNYKHTPTPSSSINSTISNYNAVGQIQELINPESVKNNSDAKKLYKNFKNLRYDFKEYLVKKNPSLYLQAHSNINKKQLLVKELLNFLEEKMKKNEKNDNMDIFQNYQNGIKGFGGLSYNLKGRLKNDIDGYSSSTIFPGRSVGLSGNKMCVGAGFTFRPFNNTNIFQNLFGENQREFMIPINVATGSINADGAVNLFGKPFNKNEVQINKTKKRVTKGYSRIVNDIHTDKSAYIYSDENEENKKVFINKFISMLRKPGKPGKPKN